MSIDYPALSPYSILSYPRSGSHQLEIVLLARFGILTNRKHRLKEINKKDGIIISIIRNPIDCIASELAMAYGRDSDVLGKSYELYKNKMESDFIDSMNEINDNADIIIDFEEMISNYDSVVEKLSKILNIRAFNDVDIPESENQYSSDGTMVHTKTSKNLIAYEEIHKLCKHDDFSKSFAVYQKVLSKVI